MAKQKVFMVTGYVGSDPKFFGEDENRRLSLSIGTTLYYPDKDDDEDKGETRWVNGTIWEDSRPDLVEYVLQNVSKGTPVAAEGYLKTDREYKDVQQFDLSIHRIGVVDWAKRGKGSSSKAKSKAKAKPAESEDLGW